MSKLYSIIGVVILAMSASLYTWAANPCKPIAKACMKEGYYKGGNKVGKGLIENCVMPIVEQNKTLPNTTFSDTTLQQCKEKLMQQIKNKQS